MPVVTPPPQLQRLSELPALVVADPAGDVRGWKVRGDDGRVVGVIADLLADPDRLIAEFLVVAPAEPGEPEVLVPLAALASGADDYLVFGSGLGPVRLRYRSTLPLTAWAGGAALSTIVIWLLAARAC